ncbi:PREDICTED: disease resistance protein RPM1-like [Nelumbo nucifera]|uniref:Disease resistance protein RPM1-like n=2 Tax=Nelumbo nucifera TaxID=4432 RepID=A0A822YU28_NELNU|nr:PREDICTED: disease resistance protein RPM1-like [Nelumbo nucifera]DAD36010.1 TPA_asm: hypothetical protein HUJ06_006650 [Nelumbo nucifera]
MAEIAVEFLLSKVASIIHKEASLISGAQDEFHEIKLELEKLRSLARDADQRSESDEGVRTWVTQVRESAYELEDIIDEFTYSMQNQANDGIFRRFFLTAVDLSRSIVVRSQIATKLEAMNIKIRDLVTRSERYGIKSVGAPIVRDSRGNSLNRHGDQSSPYVVEDEHVVGIEENRLLLLAWLRDGEPERKVISVVGSGGLGKTTLVSQVFNNLILKRSFDCYAWVTVSQTYTIENVLRKMVSYLFDEKKELFPDDLSAMDYRRLVDVLVDFLKQKRYLIVLDDVRTLNLWGEIVVALPDAKLRSRIMITTREMGIASSSYGVRSHVLHLQPLQEKDAWTLFCKISFSRYPHRCCPQHLLEVSQILVGKCGGLPLAIVAMGGLMSFKGWTELEWWKVDDNLSDINRSSDSILSLCFSDLPYYLKLCLLYCCVFSEDYLIRRKRLIRLWIAEGFVRETGGKDLEEVAEAYHTELISRNLLEVASKNSFGMVKECRLHNLVRDVLVSVSERENFCVIYDGLEPKEVASARRLSLHKIDRRILSCTDMSSLRSFFLLSAQRISASYPISGLPFGFKLLRVLDLQGIPIKRIPDCVVDLSNLRYLNLRETLVTEIPGSLGRLRYLQTLDIRDSQVKELPNEIVQSQSLHHLITSSHRLSWAAFHFIDGMRVPSNIWKLKELRVLECVEAEGDMIRQLGNMKKLRRIGLTKLSEGDGRDLCTALQNMQLLYYLFLMASNEEESLELDALWTPPPLLKILILAGKLERVPRWFRSLDNLMSLHLHWSQVREDLLSYIDTLPNLGRLTLVNANDGHRLCFRAGGFLKLRILRLWNSSQLYTIEIEKGAMPCLKELDLRILNELRMLPQGIEYLTNLNKLTLMGVPRELVGRLDKDDSEDRSRVQHIPEIIYYYTTPSPLLYYKNLA